MTLKATAVGGNGILAACSGSIVCGDLLSCRPPRLKRDASCGTSHVTGTGVPGDDWDVCALD